MKELNEYLKDLYPDASDEMIEYYIHLIEESEQEKLPPTKEMLEFAKLKKKITVLEDELEVLKQEIIKQKERIGHNFQLINISKQERKTWKESEFYKWVASLVDEKTLEAITIKTIDAKKFMKLEADKKIEYDEIPSKCYSISDSSWTISLSRSKDAQQKLNDLTNE